MPSAAIGSAAASAASRAASRSVVGRRQTNGQTSSAPMCGCRPAWQRRSISSSAWAAPASAAARSSSGVAGERVDAAVVLAVEVDVRAAGRGRPAWPRARRSPARCAPRRSWGRRAASARPSLRRAARRRGRAARRPASRSASSRRSRGGPAPGPSPPIAAEAPKATCAVPRIFSSSRMLPVRIAFSLVPMPSSATFVPSLAVLRQQLHEAPSPAPRAPRSGARPRRPADRLRRLPHPRERAVDHQRALAARPGR